LAALTAHYPTQRSIIEKIGFGFIYSRPHQFRANWGLFGWLLLILDHESSSILLQSGKQIPVNAHTVRHAFSFPHGEKLSAIPITKQKLRGHHG
jgi:hypothetical protein